jgi:hypothetical protein
MGGGLLLAIIVLYTLRDTFDTLQLECQKCHEARRHAHGRLRVHVRRRPAASDAAEPGWARSSGGGLGASHPQIAADSALVWQWIGACRGDGGCCKQTV